MPYVIDAITAQTINVNSSLTINGQPVIPGGGGLEGTSYLLVTANGTPTENAAELQAAYDLAKTMSPSSANTITVIAAPGYYDFADVTFDMNTPYIDLVSLDGNRSILFSSASAFGTLWITGDNIFVSGVNTTINSSKALCVGDNLPGVKIQNCKGGIGSFGYGGTINGTFIDCEASTSSFGSAAFMSPPVGVLNNLTPLVVSGTFINCVAKGQSFGSAMFSSVSVSGTFNNCIAGDSSFGFNFMGSGIASGIFIECVGGLQSFGGGSGTASGTFIRCTGGMLSWGGSVGTLSGLCYYCELTGSNAWRTVSGSGKTIYCIDSLNGPNNQGFTPQNKV